MTHALGPPEFSGTPLLLCRRSIPPRCRRLFLSRPTFAAVSLAVSILFSSTAATAQPSSARSIVAPPIPPPETPPSPPDRHHLLTGEFQNFSVEQGLPAHNVFDVHQDAEGFLWFGTLGGASRFDGEKIRTLPLRGVHAFCTDRTGRLWIASKEVACIDLVTDSIVVYRHDPDNEHSLGGEPARDFAEDVDGILWIAHDAGLDRFDPQTGLFTHPEPLRIPLITSVVIDSRGNLWIASRKVIVRYRKETGRLDTVSLDPGMTWVGLAKSPDGSIWVTGNALFGLWSVDPVSLRPSEITDRGARIEAVRVMFDDSGGTYVATMTQGLKYRETRDRPWTTRRHSHNDPKGIASNHIHSMCLDRDGNLWLGTTNGVSWLSAWRKPFLHRYSDPSDKNSPPHESIRSVAPDHDGNIWLGSWGGGVGKYTLQGDLLARYPQLGPLVHAVCPDRSGLWVSTKEPGGLWRIDSRTGETRSIRSFAGVAKDLPNAAATAMSLDDGGNLWLGFEGISVGCISPDRSTLREYELDSFADVLNHSVRQLHRDSRGTVWVAGGANGLVRLDPLTGTWRRLDTTKRFCAIHEDRSGRLWVGSNEGLDLLDVSTERFTSVLNRSTFPYTPEIVDIVEDGKGMLWLVGRRNLYRLDPTDLSWHEFGPTNGYHLTSRSIHAVMGTTSAYVPSAGLIVLGTGDGTVTFRPDDVRWNTGAPDVKITDVTSAGLEADSTDGISFDRLGPPSRIVLPYDHKVLEIRFAALDYASPPQNLYAVKLDGFERDWTDVQHSNEIRYGSLPPGEYVFRVKGAHSDHVWNSIGATLEIVVTPPWWRTFTAYAAYALVILALSVAAWWMQVRRLAIRHEYQMSKFAAEKLREVDQMKSRFFTNISHEFRTPLTLILGPIRQIADRIDNEQTRDELNVVHRNAGKLLTLVNQLLDIAKLESGTMRLRASRLNLTRVLSAIVMTFAPYAERRRIKLTLTAHDDIDAYIDREKTECIMTNILSNAFKFTPEGGLISLDVRRSPAIRAGAQSKEVGDCQWAEISVTDNGIGIPRDKLPRVFDRFYQVDSIKGKGQTGTGIGLALTRELVELHKGTIEVDSEEGRGTVVITRLRLGKEHLMPEEVIEGCDGGERRPDERIVSGIPVVDIPCQPGENGERSILLIVEDNRDVRNYIKGIVARDYRIVEASDGEQGWNSATEVLPDIIISDIMMPGVDGYELCAKLKADERTSHIPVILLTAKASVQDKVEGLETGADAYITKPFEPDELRARIRNLLEQRKRIHEHFRQSDIFNLEPTKILSVDKMFLQRVLRIITDRLSDSAFGVEALAEEAAVSRSVLHRKLVSLTGEPPVELIRRVRLARAAQLIEKKFGNMSEIALEVGFSNPSYFSECFRKQFGVSPSEYARTPSRVS